MCLYEQIAKPGHRDVHAGDAPYSPMMMAGITKAAQRLVNMVDPLEAEDGDNKKDDEEG